MTAAQLSIILEKIGPDRVERSINHPELLRKSWDRCFLALAYGDPSELVEDAYNGADDSSNEQEVVAECFGLRESQVTDLTVMFDQETTVFVHLVKEWLETNRNTPEGACNTSRAVVSVG